MIRLHTQFLSLRSTTDVLTFVIEDSRSSLEIEIYVCIDEARRQAKIHCVTLKNEIVRLSVHGVLHAIGYDDHAPNQRARMWRRQEAIVKKVCP